MEIEISEKRKQGPILSQMDGVYIPMTCTFFYRSPNVPDAVQRFQYQG
jgi:hypothetical protein